MSIITRILTLPFREIKALLVPDSALEKPFLNGVRGISLLVVLFTHVIMFPLFSVLQNDVEALHNYIYMIPSFFSILWSGDKAVDVFFIMSSYLLSHQLLIEIKKTNTISLSKFYIRRFFRIFPLFFIALIVYSLAFQPSIPRFLHALLFIDNLTGTNIVPVGWSLSIEVQFYVLLPFLILFCHKIKGFTPAFLFLLVIISLAIRYFVCLSYPETYEIKWIDHVINGIDPYMNNLYFPTYSRFGPLVLGVLWAYIYESRKIMQRIKSLPTFVIVLIFAMAISVIILSMGFPFYHKDIWFYQNFDPNVNLWWIVLHRTLFAISVMIVFIFIELRQLPAYIGKTMNWVFSHRYWRVLSQLSYPMYLFHFPFIGFGYAIVFRTLDINQLKTATLLELFLSFVIATILTALFCTYFHRLIETPGIKKGKIITQSNHSLHPN